MARRTGVNPNPDYWLLGEDVNNPKNDVDNSSNNRKEEKEPQRVNANNNKINVCNNSNNERNNPINEDRSTQSKVKYSKVKQSKLNNTYQSKNTNQQKRDIKQADKAEVNYSTVFNKFIKEFENRFSASFSQDNISALKNSALKYRSQIEKDYYNYEIFLWTILKRMEDIQRKKPIKNPIRFFFSGAFGQYKYLWQLTEPEEEAGSGYHKPFIYAKNERYR
ncbi:MAG: hypothetical protein U5N56_00155 [Candidatus Marinimicrobia bacterium]|nr:hypothetical protein [Candidatus Neomarinimicrobiota bacterium]